MMTGYGHAAYAASLAEFGRPRSLPGCDGWLLEREVPGATDRDAMGSYPLFACGDWRALGQDLEDAGRDLVSVVLVADPFGNFDLPLLERTFNRGVLPFKEHQVVDFATPLAESVSSHHRRNVRKALRLVQVERIENPSASLAEWTLLYDTLVRRHGIGGIRAFSRASFAGQLAVPGMVAYRAIQGEDTVGMVLFYVQGDVAYYHLGAYSEQGYEVGAAFAVFWVALTELSEKLRYVSLGGDAGLSGDGGGLARFKRGWASATRQAFLCKHIGDADRYAALARPRCATEFFPAYRAGEFAAPAVPAVPAVPAGAEENHG